ncbi:MAG: hypothetical protein BGO98_13870 [Myxococcales bacterium 68-20]|nr:MAG: hypothetical protein BGO98_13870 [Myxococcales bacterium 68-20]
MRDAMRNANTNTNRTAMRARIRSLALGTMGASFVAVSAMVGIAACSSDDGAERARIETDSGNEASLPPPPGNGDAGPTVGARPPFDPTEEQVTCTVTPCVVQLVAGGDHFCARMSDSTVRCWGEDIWGQLGRGAPDGENRPDAGDAGAIPPVVGLSNVTQISAAARTTCALLADGSVHCWGSNAWGELGLEESPGVADEDRHPTPAPVALGGESATRVDVGTWSACASLTTGKLACWGDDYYLKLARPDGGGPGEDNVPVILGPGIAAIDTAAFAKTYGSTRTTLALTTTGDVFSWGAIAGDDGLVSGRISSRSPDLEPQRIEELAKVTSLAVSPILWREPNAKASAGDRPIGQSAPHAHACAIANGEVYCWGHSFTGALCNGLPDKKQTPAHAPVFAKAWPQQITVGHETTCIRMTDGTVQCCGEDTNGALGRGSITDFAAFFTPATAFTSHAVHVVASHSAVCALVQGGSVECWGGNARGELGGIPDKVAHPTPTKIVF